MADLTLVSGPLQARLHTAIGSIDLVGPNRAGAAQGLVISVMQASAVVNGQSHAIGRVVSSNPTATSIDLVQEFGTRQVRARLSFPFPFVLSYEVIDWQGPIPDSVTVATAADPHERLFGFGERFDALDQTGQLVEILTFDNPDNKGARTYRAVPWFISTRGYGCHLDSTSRCEFDMRVAGAGQYHLTSHGGALKLNLVFGPALTDVLSRYTAYAGRPPLPPPFAFGPWISSDVWRDGGEVRYAVEKFRQRGIPVSAFVFDSPWEKGYNDFRFNIGDETTQFGHRGTFEGQERLGFQTVPEMMRFFRENGLKVIVWMTPFVNIDSGDEQIRNQNHGVVKPDGVEDRFFVKDKTTGKPLVVPWWKGHGRPVDFTSQPARAWLSGLLRSLIELCLVDTKSGARETAIGGFKTDDGESRGTANVYIPNNALYSDGKQGPEMVNGYCVGYLKTVYEVLGSKGLLFSRSGTSGTQAFPGCWGGDNEPNFHPQNGLPSVIVAGLSAALSGFSIWGHDVGGYLNRNYENPGAADLFIRWTQFGCFSPIMQMHRQFNGNQPDMRQYPWGYAEAGESTDHNRALDNFKFYTSLHTRLFPYIYAQAQQSFETGMPIMRPPVLMHPDDANTLAVQHAYYFGADLYVAPIITLNAHQRDLYLPAGDWFDFWTNAPQAGGAVVTWTNPAQPALPASKVPVFVRKGAILPLILGDTVQTLCDANYVNNPNVTTWDGGLDVRVYPSGNSRFTMVDGTDLQCRSAGGSVILQVQSQSARALLARILAPKPAKVQRDGVTLNELPNGAPESSEGWRFDTNSGFVLVRWPQPAGSSQITLS